MRRLVRGTIPRLRPFPVSIGSKRLVPDFSDDFSALAAREQQAVEVFIR
jgi:hypothetical protein